MNECIYESRHFSTLNSSFGFGVVERSSDTFMPVMQFCHIQLNFTNPSASRIRVNKS